jgi:hypothetical protein
MSLLVPEMVQRGNNTVTFGVDMTQVRLWVRDGICLQLCSGTRGSIVGATKNADQLFASNVKLLRRPGRGKAVLQNYHGANDPGPRDIIGLMSLFFNLVDLYMHELRST